jgi:thiamine-phosphate pyrophosphorylase
VLGAGATFVQLRAKNLERSDCLALVSVMAPICARFGVPLVVNDDLDLALYVATRLPGTFGVHLGQHDLGVLAGGRPGGLVLGISTHDLAQLSAAERFDPDYVAFGPVFPTHSKAEPDPVVGLDGLARAVRATRRPVVAIGGIDATRARECIAAGASAVAVISAIEGENASLVARRATALVQALRQNRPEL